METLDYLEIIKDTAKNIISNQKLIEYGYVENKYNIKKDLSIISSIKLLNGEFDKNVFLRMPAMYKKIFDYLWPRISEIGMSIVNNNKTYLTNKLYYNWSMFVLSCWLINMHDDKCDEYADEIINIIIKNFEIDV